ncbi:MAG: DUF2141 domain-containing protein [Burkholderiaceae bacterium]
MQKNALVSMVLAIGAASAQAADLQITAQGVKNDHGSLYFALFDRESFLQKPLFTLKADPQQPVAVFSNLAPGLYAATVFQDLNGNGVLDRNLVGVPLEPVGFSNDAQGNMGPPSFDTAAVHVGTENQSIVINLR